MISSACLTLVYITAKDKQKISNLNSTIDSLKLECNLKDTAIDEATQTAMQLSDKINLLYERNPSAHKDIFSE